MSIPDQLADVARGVHSGATRRAKVSTLMGWYRLQRRREAGIARVRTDLDELGITTVPSFETADWDAQVRFVVQGVPVNPVEDAGSGEIADDVRFEVERPPGAPERRRILMRAWEVYDRVLERLAADPQCTVLSHGQNARRTDRARYPFYVLAEVQPALAESLGPLVDACRLPGAEGSSEAAPAPPPHSEPALATDAVLDALKGARRQAAELHEAMLAETTERLELMRMGLEEKMEALRFEALHGLAKELNQEEAYRILEEYERDTKGQLEAKEAELRDRAVDINHLQTLVAELEEQLGAAVEYDPAEALPTVQATVQLFATIAGDEHVSVIPDAIRSAARSSSQRRTEVLRFLLTLADFADSRYRRGETGVPAKDWFAARGYEYAGGDSQTTATRHGAEREVLIDGATVQLREHVTLFPNTNDCVSVYFLRDDPGRRVVVGYVGPHLRTGSR